MNGIIYRIFRIKTGKSYIGKTYSTIYNRLQEHIRDKDRYPNRPLYRAFTKYGLEEFSSEILGEFPRGILELKEAEFIEYYQSYGKNGYNATLGGDGRSLIKINEQELLAKYKELTTISSTAKFYNIDISTCKKLLSNKVDYDLFDKKADRRRRLSRRVLVKDTSMEFSDPYDCARFLIDCDVIDSTISERNAGLSIARACKHPSKKYKDLSFCYIE